MTNEPHYKKILREVAEIIEKETDNVVLGIVVSEIMLSYLEHQKNPYMSFMKSASWIMDMLEKGQKEKSQEKMVVNDVRNSRQ